MVGNGCGLVYGEVCVLVQDEVRDLVCGEGYGLVWSEVCDLV